MANMTQPVTRDDIEAKLRELRGDFDAGVDQAKGYGLVAGAVVLVAFVVSAYFSGRRRGRRRATLVEIRRL